MPNKYTEFIKEGEIYKIRNIIYDQIVGEIRKERMGQWMHWQLFSAEKENIKKDLEKIYQDCNDCRISEIQNKIGDLLKKIDIDRIGFSNGCLKEIVPFITSLYSKKKKD